MREPQHSRWIVALCLLATTSAIFATSPVSLSTSATGDSSSWALEITGKAFDASSGALTIELANTSSVHSVTAFGLLVVQSPMQGQGTLQIVEEELLPGPELEPGGVHRMVVRLGPAEGATAGDSQRPLGLRVDLHYEILSDTTAHGNRVHIDEAFEARAYRVDELKKSIDRLRRSRQDEKRATTEILHREAQRGARALERLRDPAAQDSETFKHRLAVRANVGDLASQAEARILSGESPGQILGTVEWILQQEHDRLALHARPADLETARLAEKQHD